LKTCDFSLTSLNYFNWLVADLTPLMRELLVYNRKRIGRVKLDGLSYYFQRSFKFNKPDEFNEGCLFEDLLNNFDDLHEPPETERFLK
jgi:hypothetical protein